MNKYSLNSLAVIFLMLCIFSSCEEDPIRGCTDVKARNTQISAEEDDGSCYYSEVIFYAKFSQFQGVNISSITLAIEGTEYGAITAVYPNGVNGCNAEGTQGFQFSNGRAVDWSCTIQLANGQVVFTSGDVGSSSISDCVKVNVTG